MLVPSNADSGVVVEQPGLLGPTKTHRKDHGIPLCLSAQHLAAASDQGSIPVTLELDSPSITVDSCCFSLGASSGAPKAGAASSTTLMKQTRLDDGIRSYRTKRDAVELHGSNAVMSERCGWFRLHLISSSYSLRLSYRAAFTP